MRIRLQQIAYPVTALGPGVRLGVWFQGCHIGCRGCMSKDTWDPNAGFGAGVDDVVQAVDEAAVVRLDGITISGGEPFEQPDGLLELLSCLDDWRTLSESDMDFLCYSGFGWERLLCEYKSILSLLDGIIPEPFVQRRPDGPIWRGSDNQPLIALTERGSRVYSGWVDADPAKRPLQVAVADGSLHYLGVPRRGDLDHLETEAEKRGLRFGGVTWR